jgi:SAM-dependent methyltransferase
MPRRSRPGSIVCPTAPSRAAAQAAAPAVRPWIRIESFDAARFPAAHFTLIIANQTLEHVRDPRGLLAAARALLKPGGALLTVSHNYRHWLMRLLGARSPIIDVEHLQLFSPASLAFALARAGFVDCEIRPFANRYPLDYWLRLAPLPRWVKRPWYGWLRRRTGGGHWMLRASVGNMLAWAATSRGGEEKSVHGTALRIASQPKNATVLGCDG